MRKRACVCRGCLACNTTSGSHGVVFNANIRSLKCPACKQVADQQREQQRAAVRGTAAQRGYGPAHVALREQLLKQWQPGDPCAHCGQPMWSRENLDLAHTADRSAWLGLAHQRCNRADGAEPGRSSG